MTHLAAEDDNEFARAFEACTVAAQDFDHTAHLRLAYIYLCGESPAMANQRMKTALLQFLNHLGAGPHKFHETMTRAWVDAVQHFMDSTPACTSFAQFIARNPVLRDSKIMLSHYSAERLFSDTARQQFVRPDRQPIPPPRAQ